MFGSKRKPSKKNSKDSKLNKSPRPGGLYEQSPLKRKIPLFTIRKFAILFIFLGIGLYAVIQIPKIVDSTKRKLTLFEKDKLQISFAHSSENDQVRQKIRDESVAKISDEIGRNLTDLSQESFLTTAKKLQAKFHLDFLQISRVGIQQLVIDFQERRPLLKVHADQLRFLSDKAQIYGEASETADGLVSIHGLFDDEVNPWIFADDATLKLSQSQTERLQESLELKASIDHQKTLADLVSLRFNRFRGFTGTFGKDGLEVSFGRKPFAKKMESLQKIFDQSSKKGSQLQRIELDYLGKAFIREKPKAI